jgi:hypothetical protein
MTQRNKNRNTRIILIVVVVAVLLVGCGFFYWNSTLQTKSDIKEQTTVQENQKVDEKLPVEKSTSPKEELVIPDWNIKFTFVPELQGTEVKYYEHKSTDGQISLSFTTSQIQALGENCNQQSSGGNVNFGDTVIVTRFKEKPRAVPDGELLNQNPINGYYYASGSPIAPCSGVNEAGNVTGPPSDVEVKDAAALRKFVKTLASI